MLPRILSAKDLDEELKRKDKAVNVWAADLMKDFLGNAYLVFPGKVGEFIAYRLDPNLNLKGPFLIGTLLINKGEDAKTYKVSTLNEAYNIRITSKNTFFESDEFKVKVDKILFKDIGNYKFLFLIRGKSVEVLVIDIFQGLINKFDVKPCSNEEVECHNNICLIKCREGSITVTPKATHPIINGVKPLLYCYGTEYYFDRTNNMIVKYVNEELSPLIKYRPVKALCLSKNTILVSNGEDVTVLDGIVGLSLYRGRTSFIDGYGSLVTLSEGGNERVVAADLHYLRKYRLTARKCIIDSKETAYCLSNESTITSLDLNTYVEEGVRPLKNEVTRNNYAIVEVKPWGPAHTYTLIGPVKVISTFQTRESLKLSIRPAKLGWQGKVLISVKSPAYRYEGSFTIKSHPSVIRRVVIGRCLHSTSGRLDDRESNFRLLLRVAIDRGSPEDYRVKVRSESLSHLRILWEELIAESPLDEWVLEIWGVLKDLNRVVRLSILNESIHENLHVGDIYISRGNCYEVLEPEHRLNTEFTDTGIIIRSSNNAKLRVYCINGVYEDSKEVRIDRCLTSPLLVEEHMTDGSFRWVKKTLIRTPLRVRVREGRRYRVSDDLGFFTIEIPRKPKKPRLIVGGVGFSRVNSSKIDVSFSIINELPSLNIVFCGDSSEVVYGRREGKIRCDFFKALNGLHLITLYPGLKGGLEALRTDGSSVLSNAIRYAVTIAEEVRRRL